VIADRSTAWLFLSDPARIPEEFEGSLGPYQSAALKGALLEWMNWDRGEALHLARTAPISRSQGLVIHLYRRWAETDPETAWNEILHEPFAVKLGGFGAGLALLPVIDSRDPTLALQLARLVPAEYWNNPEANQAVWGMLEWSMEDPARAVRIIQEIPGNAGQMLTENLARNWARKDPEAASAWAWDISMRGAGLTALLESARAWIAAAPVDAAAFLRERVPRVTDPDQQMELARVWVTVEPAPALERIRALVPESGREVLLAEILPTAAPADPATATAALAEIRDPALHRQAASRVGLRWAARSPEEALAWSQALAPGVEQESVLRSVYQGWANVNPDEAIASLSRLDSPLRDQALVGLVQSLMNQSPARAADQSLRVSDPLIQSQLLESTFQRWMSSAPDAATAWLDRSGLPEALSSRLRGLRR
jgi:hypothetical protein